MGMEILPKALPKTPKRMTMTPPRTPRKLKAISDPARSKSPTSSSTPMVPCTPRMKMLAAGRTFAGKSQRSLLNGIKGSSKWDMLTDAQSSVRILAQGHVHAKQEMSEIDRWRQEISESFVNPPQPAVVPKLKLQYPGPVEPVCRSPNHFERQYGVKRHGFSPRTSPRISPRIGHRLEPLRGCGTLATDGVLASGRAAQNVEARAECWKRARVQLGDPSNRSQFDPSNADAPRSPTTRQLAHALSLAEGGGSPVVG